MVPAHPSVRSHSWTRWIGSRLPPIASPTESSAPTGLIAGRYEVLNEIGRGGMGRVYRVLDRLTGRVVTLKRLRLDGPRDDASNAELRANLAQEFRLLACLRHPNVIGVLDYGFDEAHEPYLTMDLEENACTIIEAGANQPLAVQVDLLVQLLRALVYLHRLGIIHRDLKPENILAVRGQVKVLDFGLSLYQAAAETGSGGWGGTPAYMAPEVLRGAPPSVPADLFAVGMIAYELLTGRHPFDGYDALALYEALPTTPLPRPTDAIDPRLRKILERLLARDPAERVQHARNVILALASELGHSLAVETVVTRESFLQTAPLIGRERDLGALRDGLAAAVRGNGSTWLLGGESGVGKSRLLDELRTAALVEGVVVLRGQAVSQGGSPHHVWRDVLSQLILRVELNDADAEVLKTIVGDIDRLLGREIAHAPAVESEAAQTRLLFAVEAVFRAQPRPVLVILEDLQWAGSESLRLLGWLTQPSEQLPLMLVGSFRDDEAPDLPRAIQGAQVVRLGRLATGEIAALGEAMMGPAAREPAIRELLERETEGIPFFVVEVVRALAEGAGALDRIGEGQLPDHILSGGMQKVVRRRLDKLPPEALPALRTAAVGGREIDPAVMRTAHPELDFEEWAATCARRAVLELRDARWRFAHDKLREGLLHDLSSASLRALHRAAAEAIERAHPDPLVFAAALAHHWREAGEPAREARYAREAGMRALRSGAGHEAVRYLGRAFELLRLEGNVRVPARRRRRLRGLLDPNAHVDPDSPDFALGLIESGLSEAYYLLGDLKHCREQSEHALVHFAQYVPAGPVGWAMALFREVGRHALQRATRVHTRTRTGAARVATEIARVQLRLTDTFFYSLRPVPIVWSSFRVVNQCEPIGDCAELAQGYALLAILAGAARMRRLAEEWARRAITIADAIGIERNIAWVRSRVAVDQLVECHWADADAGIARAAAIAERVGDLRLWEEVQAESANTWLYRAQFERAASLFRDVQRLGRRTGSTQIECWALMGLGTIQSRLGSDEEARRLCQDALALIDEDAMTSEAVCALGALAIACLRTGDSAQAYEAATRALRYIRAMRPVAYWMQPAIAGTAETLLSLQEAGWGPSPAIRTNLARQAKKAHATLQRFARQLPHARPSAALCQGIASWIARREWRAFAAWQRAIDLGDRLGLPYERARAHFEIGRHLPEESDDRRHHLHQAVTLFEKFGCTLDAGLARRALARSDALLRGGSA